jgi:iron only hydrogenase large subunit-like protein
MEAAIRTAYHLLTGDELKKLDVKDVRGFDGIKEAKIKIGDQEYGVAVVSGLGNAHKLMKQLEDGRNDIHFIEVMTCPGGCIAGGGQPYNTDMDAVKARMKALYKIDSADSIRQSHQNPSIKRLYDEFLGEPLGEKSHHFLHTHYSKREVLS